MNGDLFTNFNSTLAFDAIFSIRSKIAFILCGSVTSNSSKIPIQLPQTKGKMFYFILLKKVLLLASKRSVRDTLRATQLKIGDVCLFIGERVKRARQY